jgi:mono/diheme cytochrome c family protein
MTRALPLLLLTTLAVGSVARAEDKKVDPKTLGAGRTLFLQHCASCHGADAKGHGRVADALKTPPSDLTKLVDKDGNFAVDRVRTSIDGTQASTAHGTREMPVWGKVFAETGQRRGEGAAAASVYALIEYLRSIQEGATAKAP